jgi:hypothetical protein
MNSETKFFRTLIESLRQGYADGSYDELLEKLGANPSKTPGTTLSQMLDAGLTEIREEAESWTEFVENFSEFQNNQHSTVTESIYLKVTLDLWGGDSLQQIQPGMTTESQMIFRNLHPGLYQIQTSTGLLLWEQRLESQDLILGDDASFTMAALADEDTQGQELEGTAWTLEILPGPESGSLILKKLIT